MFKMLSAAQESTARTPRLPDGVQMALLGRLLLKRAWNTEWTRTAAVSVAKAGRMYLEFSRSILCQLHLWDEQRPVRIGLSLNPDDEASISYLAQGFDITGGSTVYFMARRGADLLTSIQNSGGGWVESLATYKYQDITLDNANRSASNSP
jgi:hypothetical protein